MVELQVARVEIDSQRRLHVAVEGAEFPLVYRAGMEVAWDQRTGTLNSPQPRDWSYERWYQQIFAAVAQEYGCKLVLSDHTSWINVDAGTIEQLLVAYRNGA